MANRFREKPTEEPRGTTSSTATPTNGVASGDAAAERKVSGNRFREKPIIEKPVEVTPPPAPSTEETVQETAATKQTVAQEKSGKKGTKLGKTERALSHVIGGDVLADRFVIKQIPLVLVILLCFLAVVANRYNVEKIIKDKAATEENIARLRERRIEIQKQYQQGVKISHIAEVLQGSGVGITAGPPYVIEK